MRQESIQKYIIPRVQDFVKEVQSEMKVQEIDVAEFTIGINRVHGHATLNAEFTHRLEMHFNLDGSVIGEKSKPISYGVEP